MAGWKSLAKRQEEARGQSNASKGRQNMPGVSMGIGPLSHVPKKMIDGLFGHIGYTILIIQ
jgi:hypothetical protein